MKLLEEYGIKEDARFKQVKKEAFGIFIYWVIYSAWVYGWAYYGARIPVGDYTYIMGMPQWYFMAFLVYGILSPIACIVLALKLKDCSLSANGKEDSLEEE